MFYVYDPRSMTYDPTCGARVQVLVQYPRPKDVHLAYSRFCYQSCLLASRLPIRICPWLPGRLFDALTGSSLAVLPYQVPSLVPSAFALSRARIRNFEHTSPVQAIQDPISTRVDLSIDTTLLYPPSLYHRHVRHPCLGP